MGDLTYVKSVAELLDPKILASSLSWTAGGASDNVTWTGFAINREGFSTGSIARSADIFVAYDATLASGSNLSFTFDLQDSPDGVNYSDYATSVSTVAATGPSGGGKVLGIARLLKANDANTPAGTPGVDLNGARHYIRVNVVPHLSRAGTDTAVITVIGEFGGFDLLAAPQV